MAPPNRGSSKALNNLAPARAPSVTSFRANTPSSSTAPNLFSISEQSTVPPAFPSLSIPYPTIQDHNVFAFSPSPDTSYGSIFPSSSGGLDFNAAAASQHQQSAFSSPASPSPQYLSINESTLGPLDFPSDPTSMTFDDSAIQPPSHYGLYNDSTAASTSPLSRKSTSTESSAFYGDVGPQDYPVLGLATKDHRHLSSFSQQPLDVDMDGPHPQPSQGYTYNFSGAGVLSPSTEQDDEDEDILPPHNVPALGSSTTLPITKSTGYAPSSKEKEQNKQKLYRNRKSEFTNRMRDELLAMNLLPHSRVTHAPEIMSKTADTLKDYRELLILIKESVDGMPENLASVPGAVRKMLNENSSLFSSAAQHGHGHGPRPAAAPIAPMQQTPYATKGDYKVPLGSLGVQRQQQPGFSGTRGVRGFC